MKLMKLIN